MRILRNYILKEMAAPFIGTLGIFTFVLLIGNMFKLADLLVNKGVSIFYVLQLFIYLVPFVLSHTIPMAMLTATMLCFGRLSSDNEVTAMRASGISLYAIGLPVLIASFVISLFCVYLNDNILPMSHFASYKLIKEVGIKNPTAYLEPGTFIKDFKGYIIRIGSIEGNKLNDILIYQLQENQPTRTVIAKSGEFSTYPKKNILKLKLMDGTADEPSPDNPNIFYKLNFKVYNMSLDIAAGAGQGKINKKPKDMSVSEIKADIGELKKLDQSAPIRAEIRERETEIQKKIATGFSSFVFVLVALPLAINTRRREKSIGFGLSLVVLTVYYLILIGGEALSLRNILPPAIAMWSANIIYTITGGALFAAIMNK